MCLSKNKIHVERTNEKNGRTRYVRISPRRLDKFIMYSSEHWNYTELDEREWHERRRAQRREWARLYWWIPTIIAGLLGTIAYIIFLRK